MGAIDRILADARSALVRIAPSELESCLSNGAIVVDIRPAGDREREGALHGAVVIERNVLEWRLDPTSEHHVESRLDHETHVIIVCNDGYASSLAAESLQRLGLVRATDLAGGYRAWRRAKQAVADAGVCVGPVPISAGTEPMTEPARGRSSPPGSRAERHSRMP